MYVLSLLAVEHKYFVVRALVIYGDRNAHSHAWHRIIRIYLDIMDRRAKMIWTPNNEITHQSRLYLFTISGDRSIINNGFAFEDKWFVEIGFVNFRMAFRLLISI